MLHGQIFFWLIRAIGIVAVLIATLPSHRLAVHNYIFFVYKVSSYITGASLLALVYLSSLSDISDIM